MLIPPPNLLNPYWLAHVMSIGAVVVLIRTSVNTGKIEVTGIYSIINGLQFLGDRLL